MRYYSNFFELLNPYALVGGLVSLLGFTLHGAIFLTLKSGAPLADEARAIAWRVWIPTVVFLVLYSVLTYSQTDILTKLGVNPGVIPIGAVLALLLTGWLVRIKRDGWAFISMATAIVLSVATIFLHLYPRLMVSSLNPEWSLTIQNSSSSPYTLQVLTIVALIFVPIVLVYQGWTYWVFRKRITQKPEDLHY
jgi:cytochrome d ubiquinol oxidase subunit II